MNYCRDDVENQDQTKWSVWALTVQKGENVFDERYDTCEVYLYDDEDAAFDHMNQTIEEAVAKCNEYRQDYTVNRHHDCIVMVFEGMHLKVNVRETEVRR